MYKSNKSLYIENHHLHFFLTTIILNLFYSVIYKHLSTPSSPLTCTTYTHVLKRKPLSLFSIRRDPRTSIATVETRR